jgi:predicted small metal-binding protein
MAHQYSCGACAFQVRSEDDDELIELVRNHAEERHEMEVAPRDVRDGWVEIDTRSDG